MAHQSRNDQYPSGSTKEKVPGWKKAIAGVLAGTTLGLLACGNETEPPQNPPVIETTDMAPTTNKVEPTASPSVTDLPSTEPIPGIDSTEPIASATNTETAADPNEPGFWEHPETLEPLDSRILSFEEEFPKYRRELSQEVIDKWVEDRDVDAIANAMVLEMLNASEHTEAMWLGGCEPIPVKEGLSIWKSIDNMNDRELACQVMFGLGVIATSSSDGRLIRNDNENTPFDLDQATILTSLYFDMWKTIEPSRNISNVAGFLKRDVSTQNNLTFGTTGTVRVQDFSFTERAKRISEGEEEVGGKVYRTIDIEMGDPLQRADQKDTIVVRSIVVPVETAYGFYKGSEWELYGGERGDGSMSVSADGTPITPDGSQVAIMIPWVTMDLFNKADRN